MTKVPTSIILEENRLPQQLLNACEELGSTDDKVTLDFSSVRRIDPGAIQALETLADKADEKAANVVVCRVNVDVYKVLKLARLSRRFSFVD